MAFQSILLPLSLLIGFINCSPVLPVIPSANTLCPTASWNPSGITVAGGTGCGGQLCAPCAVAFDQDGNLYVADTGHYRIVKYVQTPNGQNKTMISDIMNVDTATIVSNSLYFNGYPLINGIVTQKVQKLDLKTNTKSIVVSNITDEILGLYVDKVGSIYLSTNKKVTKYAAGHTTGLTVVNAVAANSGFGDLFVDERDNTVYVCDTDNNQVQKWVQGAKVGITVAGGNGQGANLNQFFYPEYMTVDIPGGFIYVSDTFNNRIVRWSLKNGTKTGELVVGGGTTYATSLSVPQGIAFDKEYNLYVADFSNSRIQKFLFNKASCPTKTG